MALFRSLFTAGSIFALLACAPATSSAGSAAALSAPAKADLDWSGPLAAGGKLVLSNVSGDVTVTQAAGNQARVRAYKSGRDAAKVEIKVEQKGNRLAVHPKYPRRGNTDADVAFVIEVPKGVSVEASVVSGSLTVTGVAGKLKLDAVNGNIATSGATDVTVNTVNGNAVVRLPNTATRAKLTAVNGALEVRLPADLGVKIRATTMNGSIVSDFPLERHDGFVSSEASGNLGDGKAAVSVETVNGKISLAKA